MHRIVKDSSLATELNERQAREETHSRQRNAHGPPQHFEALENSILAMPCCQLSLRAPSILHSSASDHELKHQRAHLQVR